MLHSTGVDLAEDDLDPSFAMPEGLTPKEEINHLKKKHGGWALTPALINKQSMFEKELIAELGRPLWTHYCDMTRDVKTCQERV